MFVLVTVAMGPPSSAQEWSWPEKPQNLKILPKEWPGSRLEAPMTGFTRALGVRCSHCHVGEEGKPLSTYDFASDGNPNKDRAREMLRMLGDVNDHLDKIEPSGDQRINMWCHTCHRGRPRPMTLGEELGEAYRARGLDAAFALLADLKERFYRKGAYDFSSATTLNELGYAVLGAGDTAGAIKVLTMNSEQFPESSNAWDSLGEAHMKAGDTQAAEQHYKKSLELDPSNQNAKDMLKKMAGGGGG